MLEVICGKSCLKLADVDCFDFDRAVFLDSDISPSIDDFLKIVSHSLSLVPSSYQKVAAQLSISGRDEPLIVPISKLHAQKLDIKKALDDVLSVESNIEYLESFLNMRQFLDSMHPCFVDEAMLRKLIDSQKHDGVKSNLKSFLCDDLAVKYCMSSSSTGRLSVSSGPKILTAPGIVKSTFKSRHPAGKVLQIDLSCAEPNFALFVEGEDPMSDLYSFVSRNVLMGEVDRKVAKLITLSALYGQSTRNLKKQLPANIHPAGVIKKVKKFLFHDKLFGLLKSNMLSSKLRNYLGRPLRVEQERLLISHYLQSSVAEVAIEMFKDFCSENAACTPWFVIHDALIIDCEAEHAERLLRDNNFKLPFRKAEFPATITQLG